MRDEFKIKRQGKDFVLFAGLLDAFHEKANDFDDAEGKARAVIETNLEQAPKADNGGVAIVHARAGYKVGDEWVFGPFDGIGDASEQNVGKNIEPHKIRMAETRAKARALRDAINVSAEVLEDMGEEPQQAPPQQQRSRPPSGTENMKGAAQQAPESQPPPVDPDEPIHEETLDRILAGAEMVFSDKEKMEKELLDGADVEGINEGTARRVLKDIVNLYREMEATKSGGQQ